MIHCSVFATCREELLPIADLVTPNLPEASALIGGEDVVNISDMREAAQAIHALGPR
jgi:hydroxymethylpyrimidine kinase/phosphomethylpyrimidine kinase/thiamine-phosphate diphosphorylase